MGTASSAACLSLANKGWASCSVSQQTVGSALLPECQRRMWSLYLLHAAQQWSSPPPQRFWASLSCLESKLK